MFQIVTDQGRRPIPSELKQHKLNRIQSILKDEYLTSREERYFNCLSEELRIKFSVQDDSGISENAYHAPALDIIEKYKNGLILDVGAGLRSSYYNNVVNLDIMCFETNDVIAVCESLPFKDNVFDAVHSNAVLEHVKDPFLCAKEIMRVLKPGGELMCCVPFLQPFHSSPHHYYNMTREGLRNLFPDINVTAIEVYEELRPLTSLQLIINDWSSVLTSNTKERFLNMKLKDFINANYAFRDDPIVTELSPERISKLACAHTLFGKKIGPIAYTLLIDNATYGAKDTWKDVTGILRSLITDESLTLSVDMSLQNLFGDPIYGTPKELIINWSKINLYGETIAHGSLKGHEFCGHLRTPLLL